MKSYETVHQAAIFFLAIVAAMSVGGSFRVPNTLPFVRVASCIVAIAMWSFLIRKIWMRPRQWGLGVGIFLCIMFAFQSYLWYLAGIDPQPEKLTMKYTTFNFALYELPLVCAAICCLLLRWVYPRKPTI